MWFSFFIYDFPLEYMVEGSLNNYITNGFLNYYSHNNFFLDFISIECGWLYPIDIFFQYGLDLNIEYNFLWKIIFNIFPSYDLNNNISYDHNWLNNFRCILALENYFYFEIFETFKLMDIYIINNNYYYSLFICENNNYLDIIINKSYFFYLNNLIYINLFYIFTNFIIFFKFFANSIIFCFYNIKIFIYYYLYKDLVLIDSVENIICIFDNIKSYQIFYYFLDVCTNKMTIIYYIYLIYIFFINLSIFIIFYKFIKIYIYFFYFFKFNIYNINMLNIYINILNLKVNIYFNNVFTFKFNIFNLSQKPNTTIFYMLLFFKRIKNIYIIKYIYNILMYIKLFFNNIFYFIYIYILFFIKLFFNLNNKFIYVINKHLKIEKYVYVIDNYININPIYKFFSDKTKFTVKNFMSKEDKLYFDLIRKEDDEILFGYWQYLQVFYYNYTYIMFIKFVRIILFTLIFIIKFLIFKIFKYIIKFSILTKFLNILIYYIINIYLFIKLIIKYIIIKYILYIYYIIKNNIIYFLNMFVHYKLFKFFTRLFLYESYYLNSEMVDKFPYYSSKYLVNFIIWFDVMKSNINNIYNIKIITLSLYYIYCFINKLLIYTLIIIPYISKFIYSIIIIQIKVIKYIIKNKTLNFLFFIMYLIIFIILLKYIYLFYNFFYILIFTYFIIVFFKYININYFFWYIGLYILYIYDFLILLLNKLINIFIKIIKYFIIYPFILFFIIFFFFNNPIIYIKLSYMLKLFILPLYNIIYNIINYFNDYITIYIFLNNSLFSRYIQINFSNIQTINKWLNYADGIYWEIWETTNWWWIYRKIYYNIFFYYTPFDYLWFEGLYAFEEIYSISKYITHYFFLYIYILIIYYFWFLISIISEISYIFSWINYLNINEFIFYYIYTSKIIYISLFKIYIYNYIYIFFPFYIIQPILKFYTYFYEYYFIIKYFGYNIYIINQFKIILIYLYTLFTLIINDIYVIINNMTYNINLLLYFIWSLYFNMVKYIYIYLCIYIYLISDIIYNINLYYILYYIFIYTNIDFFIFDKYSKIIIFKDSIYSSFRFPIEYFNKLNNNKYYYKYFQKYYFWMKKERLEYITEILNIDYSTEDLAVGRWKEDTIKISSKFIMSLYNDNLPKWYQTLNSQPHYNIKYLYYSYKLFKFKKLLILFPYLWSLFWIYYIFIYIISCFIIIKLYKIIFLDILKKKKELYISNTYAWDKFCNKETYNNYITINKNNKNLYNYYYKEILKNNKDYIIYNKKSKFSINNDLKKKKNLIKKYKYISIYKNYILFKNSIKFLLNKINMNTNNLYKYKLKFKLLLLLKTKFFNSLNELKLYDSFIRKITFDFKNLVIYKKYNWLYNIIFNEEKKLNFFSSYYYNSNKYIPYIYNHYYEEPFIDGAIKFNINEDNYNYISKNIYKLYNFYKWFDKVFLYNNGSFYLFHKDPRVPYISKDLDNNKYYYNTSIDYNNQIYILFIFIAIPLIIWSTYLSTIFHFTNEMDYQFFDIFYMHLTFWISWFMTQFTILHDGFLKIFFSFMGDSIYMFTLDNEEENILSHGDTEFHNWFNYEVRTRNIFPLYNHYNTKYYLFQIFQLNDNINIFKLIILHIKYNILNLYDILYVNYYSLNSYNFEYFIYNTFKIIIIIIYFIYIFFYNNIYKFYHYKKISINLIKYSYKLKNLYLMNISFLLNSKKK